MKLDSGKVNKIVNDPLIKLIDKMIDEIKSNNNKKIKNNVIISTQTTCCYVFKRGKNKGVQCKCKKIHQDGLCKMHYKLYIKAQQKMVSTLEN